MVPRSGYCFSFVAWVSQERIGHDVSAVVATPRLDLVSGKAEAGEKVLWVKRREFAFPAGPADRAPGVIRLSCEFETTPGSGDFCQPAQRALSR